MSWPIAGVGAVASVGGDTGAVFEALCAGRSGLAPLRAFDGAHYQAANAYEIDDRPASGDVPLRATAWLIRAVEEALRDAGLDDDLTSVPILVGTGLRELRSAELSWRDGAEFDLERLHFGTALRERFGATRTYTVANACSASLYTLGMATDLLAAGEADTVVVAGVDTLTESMYGLLDAVQRDPPESVRPFDRTRRGTLIGDGAVAVVLRAEDAGPGAGGRGLLRAVSMNCDAAHVTAPDAPSITESIHAAHRDAGVGARDIDLVLLHGTGTPLNDEAEVTAMSQAFGADVGAPLMTAIKCMTGHTSGGSGLLSLVVALRALESGRIPPITGLTDPLESAAGFRFVREPATGADLRIAQVNAFGFGGVNAVAVVEGVSR
jgi:3-oxoacyl-[acyl-carrier-protein] synthase II